MHAQLAMLGHGLQQLNQHHAELDAHVWMMLRPDDGNIGRRWAGSGQPASSLDVHPLRPLDPAAPCALLA
jgi:hypothetical protein